MDNRFYKSASTHCRRRSAPSGGRSRRASLAGSPQLLTLQRRRFPFLHRRGAAFGLGCAVAFAAAAMSGGAAAQSRAAAPAASAASSVLRAERITGRTDGETVASGEAEFRRGNLLIQADELRYNQGDDRAAARGDVRIEQDGNRFSGPELQLKVEDFSGYFLNPSYFFARAGGGGNAERLDFIDRDRAVAHQATYTSCLPDGSGAPAWLLSSSKVELDFASNEGVATGAVLRFYGVPILAAPKISFPLTDARKSGWLPPLVGVDNKSGLSIAAPYYWNIAPNLDATLTPTIRSRRGVGLNSELRYRLAEQDGRVSLNLLPFDRQAGRARYALGVDHDAELAGQLGIRLRVRRVSDDNYWQDFLRDIDALTPRLLLSDLQASRPFGNWTTYARVMSWQVLQTLDTSTRIDAPYERRPQIGARTSRQLPGGFAAAFEGEVNQFADPAGVPRGSRPTGVRLHALGSVSRPVQGAGWSVTPKLALNAATYSLDGPAPSGAARAERSRVIPTLSVDSAWQFERNANWFGRNLVQTLEPRLLYVNTPYRDQRGFAIFDSAQRDFNFDAIFTPNSFSGVDRVSDSHQVTAGVTTRLLDPASGAESLRLGLAQRVLLRDQRVTPDNVPLTQHVSDLLLLASTTVVPNWTFDASTQYSPDIGRTTRSLLGARYSPGPFRTVNLAYRFTRSASEQVELGWQWPIYGTARAVDRAGDERGGPRSLQTPSCDGAWYGVGRVNYSTRDSRVTDSLLGLEYDAGCWIGRIVGERLSTGRSEANTRLMVQLELVGLSRLGSNPLQTLKDNIPGYRLLRESPAPGMPPTP